MYLQPAQDLFLFATDIRRIVQSCDPITQGVAFAQGRSYGLKVGALAGMAHRSKSHVRQMLMLLTLSQVDMTAIEGGAPYSPILAGLRQRHRVPGQ
jgi:hypothetical protein